MKIGLTKFQELKDGALTLRCRNTCDMEALLEKIEILSDHITKDDLKRPRLRVMHRGEVYDEAELKDLIVNQNLPDADSSTMNVAYIGKTKGKQIDFACLEVS